MVSCYLVFLFSQRHLSSKKTITTYRQNTSCLLLLCLLFSLLSLVSVTSNFRQKLQTSRIFLLYFFLSYELNLSFLCFSFLFYIVSIINKKTPFWSEVILGFPKTEKCIQKIPYTVHPALL